jgi:hypothetical protein
MFKLSNFRPLMDMDGDVGGGESVTTPEIAPTETQTTSTVEATTEATTTDTSTADATDGAKSDTPKGEVEPATQPKQTAEQDRFFADNRRKLDAAEKRANDAEAQRTSDREIAKKYGQQYGVFSDADVAEKYGKSHGVNTIAEFETALRNEEYTKAGIDPEMINKLINEHPAIKEAREAKEANTKSQQDRFLVDSFSELTKEFPSMAKAEDVPADVWRKWNNGSSGITLADAYALVNRKEITAKQAESTKQATLNSIQGKGHLQGNGKGVEGDTVRIPDDVMEMYKRFNPKGTAEQYKAHYKASQK